MDEILADITVTGRTSERVTLNIKIGIYNQPTNIPPPHHHHQHLLPPCLPSLPLLPTPPVPLLQY